MRAFRVWGLRVFTGLALLLGLLAVPWGYARLTSPTPAQREALALMQRPPLAEGLSGWSLLAELPEPPADTLPEAADCRDAVDCVARLQQALETAPDLLEAWRPRLEAAARVLRAASLRPPEGLALSDYVPPFSPLVQVAALRAHDFARGEFDQALDAACRDAQGAIVRASQPETLIEAQIGIAVFRRYAGLIADMRRHAPERALPQACMRLAEPPDPAADGTLCAALRGEWYSLRDMLAIMEAPAFMDPADADGAREAGQAPALSALWHDVDWLLARSAERFASACGAQAQAAARADQALALTAPPPRWVDRIGFPLSVWLDGFSDAAYTDYAERQLDHLAERRLLAALLQMEMMPPSLSPAERFAALPEALREGPRPLSLDDAGGVLSVSLRSRRPGLSESVFRLALPPVPQPSQETQTP